MLRDIKFSKVLTLGCWGRNRYINTSGLQIAATDERIAITPINSRGDPTKSCDIDLPIEDVEPIARALVALAKSRLQSGPSPVDLLRELVDYERAQFDGDPDVDLHVSGSDTVDWLAEFRLRARDALRLYEQEPQHAPE